MPIRSESDSRSKRCATLSVMLVPAVARIGGPGRLEPRSLRRTRWLREWRGDRPARRSNRRCDRRRSRVAEARRGARSPYALRRSTPATRRSLPVEDLHARERGRDGLGEPQGDDARGPVETDAAGRRARHQKGVRTGACRHDEREQQQSRGEADAHGSAPLPVFECELPGVACDGTANGFQWLTWTVPGNAEVAATAPEAQIATTAELRTNRSSRAGRRDHAGGVCRGDRAERWSLLLHVTTLRALVGLEIPLSGPWSGWDGGRGSASPRGRRACS